MALLERIVHPNLNSAGSDAEYIGKLSEWQQVVREYKRISGKELDQTVKTATLIEDAPPHMQEHLRLRFEEIGTHYKKVILAIEGDVRSNKTMDSGGQLTRTLAQSARAKVSPKERARARANVRTTRAKDSPKAKTKEKSMSLRTTRSRSQTASVPFVEKPGHFDKDCDHRVRAVNEVTKTAPVVHTRVCNYRTWTLVESCVQPKHFCQT